MSEWFWSFLPCCFGFVSGFGFRISDLGDPLPVVIVRVSSARVSSKLKLGLRPSLPLISPPMKQKAYARAGVDIDLGNRVKSTLPRLLAATHRPEVLGKVGGFGGLFALDVRKYRQPVLRLQRGWRRHQAQARLCLGPP